MRLFNIFWNHPNLPLIPLALMQPIKNHKIIKYLKKQVISESKV